MKLSVHVLAVSTSFLVYATTRATSMTVGDSASGNNGESNVVKKCYPEVTDDELVPPCVSIANIEQACQPNGTNPNDFEAHAQCLCGGSYFMDWRGCQACLFVHGFRSARDHAYWEQVVSVASNSLCHALPTADFQSIFSTVQANAKEAEPVTTGETKSSDQFPSQMDVSIYYTATGPQGPGAIAGAAAAATQVSRPAANSSTSLSTNNSGDMTAPSQTSARSNKASTRGPDAISPFTAGAPAQRTGVAMFAVAGAALLMAL